MSLKEKNLDSLLCNTAILLGSAKIDEENFIYVELPSVDNIQLKLHKIIKKNKELFGDVLFNTNGPVPYSEEINEYIAYRKLTGTLQSKAMKGQEISISFKWKDINEIETDDKYEIQNLSAELAKYIIDQRGKLAPYFNRRFRGK